MLKVQTMEERWPAPGRVTKTDPNVAVEVMHEVIGTADPKKKRAFLGAFIERVAVSLQNVTVDCRPEALLNAGSKSSVRSECRWLLDLGSNQGPTD